jgi:hypothetical protein
LAFQNRQQYRCFACNKWIHFEVEVQSESLKSDQLKEAKKRSCRRRLRTWYYASRHFSIVENLVSVSKCPGIIFYKKLSPHVFDLRSKVEKTCASRFFTHTPFPLKCF